MTGALLAFSAMAVSVRALGSTLTVMEIIASRAVLGLAVMAVLAGINPQLRATINSRRLGLHLLRNTVHLGAQYLWTASLLLLPLATVFALEFTAPAWALLLALPVLGERMTASRIGAVVLGLLGVLVILRPGLQTFRPAALLVLAAAVGLAITLITTKKLTRCMVRPCVARGFRRSGGCGVLHQCIRLLIGAICSEPSWISARMRSY